jgi:hypothetical protein
MRKLKRLWLSLYGHVTNIIIVAVKLLKTGLRGGTPLWGAAPHAQLVKMS